MEFGSVLNCFYQNVRGLRTKTKIFFRNLLNCNYDVVFLSETWLLPGIFDAELFDSRYNVYRTDRNYELRGMTMGGGTLIAVKRQLLADSNCNGALPDFPDADVTQLDILLSRGPNARRLHLYCCYFPETKNQIASQQAFLETISDLSIDRPADDFLIIGDFNIRNANWFDSDCSASRHEFELANPSIDILTSQMFSFMSFTGFSQCNGIANNNNRCLDLVLTNLSSCLVSRTDPLAEPEDGHHPSLVVTVQVNSSAEPCLKQAPSTIRKFYAADYDSIKAKLNEIRWDEVLSSTNIDSALDSFYKIINDVIDEYVPIKQLKDSSGGHPVWFSPVLVKMIKRKHKAHKKWKTYGRLSDYERFSDLRREVKKLEKFCYDLFIARSEININKCSKHFWSFIKSKKKLNSIPDMMKLDDEMGYDGSTICNMFNIFFQSVFEPETPTRAIHNNPENNYSHCIINNVEITQSLVKKYLTRLNANKGSGPDGIHPLFLKTCSKQLAAPVAHLFRLSMSTGVMPDVWKKSYVVPIFKSGDKHDVRNYRGISKLSVLPKVFEKIVYDCVYPTISSILIPEQHGFVARRSTETNLGVFLDFVLESMGKGCQVDAVYTDYSKAFDKISHSILISKLEEVGIHGDLLRWLASYLRNRTQAVTTKGFTSSFTPISSGVPQGSHLGPLLFNIYINDVIKCFTNSKVLFYADDTKIFFAIKDVEDCIMMQNDLNRLCEYCTLNEIYLNVDKCCTITFTRKKNPLQFNYSLQGKILKRVKEIRDLGVQLDSGLYFESHINKITAKAYKLLGFIFRQGTDFRNVSTLTLLYNAYVRSQLEYASTVWNPHYQKYQTLLEGIQNRFIRRLKFKFKNYNVNSIESLASRRKFRDQIFLFKIVNNLIDSPYLLNKVTFMCPRPSARLKNTFCIPLCRTNYAQNSFVVRATNAYNKSFVHLDIFHEKLMKYRRLLRKV